MRWVALVLFATACGRIGFDGSARAGDGGGSDAGLEGIPAVCETDDDCRGCGACGNSQSCDLFDFKRFSFGHVTSLGVAADGSYWGWGANSGDELQLGDVTNISIPRPLPANDLYTNVVISNNIGAGLAADGSIWSWGGGNGLREIAPAAAWTELQVAWAWGCAVKASDRSLWCWGDNYRANLGDLTHNDSAIPIQINIPPVATYAIDTYQGCAITMAQELWCWGDNGHLAGGDPTPGNDEIVPTKIGTRADWKLVAAGGGVACAMTQPPGALECWGEAYKNGRTDDSAVPTAVDATSYKLFRSNFDHTCAIAVDGTVWCFGVNGEGQLGVGDHTYRLSPTQIALPGPADELTLGGHLSCAHLTAGTWWCWGRNDGGQQGIGTIGANIVSPYERCP